MTTSPATPVPETTAPETTAPGTTGPRVPTLAELRERLPELSLRDEHRLGQQLRGGRQGGRRGQPLDLERLSREVDAAQLRMTNRRAGVPELRYPEHLPVVQRREDILEAIRDHQVVVVAGETGSGKTTQIPKICLELGRGVRGLIGHTQPRRIAARTVAERIAEELDTPLGEAVGYTVRFTDQVGEHTLVKLMTDGILLAEVQRDPLLRRYDTLIIDEAHERSLNIDFLLGYLAQLLPRRPDLKVVITSATIDPEAFAEHFAGPDGPAPIVEVSGRTFPVEIRYRPLVLESGVGDDGTPTTIERDPVDAVCDAVAELGETSDGDVLVFLSGEREIRDTADALRERDLRATEILPLYARLSAAEQHRVFQPPPAGTRRRVVLATNVAETSLTVPGIRYVVDPGTARISRYSVRTKVQRLPIEPVSQASANQRAGRCGRVADGICIRLYSEDDYESRPEFTDPEILRTNLASVILQMSALGLGDVAAFPFLQPPEHRAISDGVALLAELGAIDPAQADPNKRLTRTGRDLAALPVDPRMARMLLQAKEAGATGCLAEMLVIVSALSIQDPRERPVEHQQAADERHARFRDPTSDFLAYLNLWNHLREQRNTMGSSAFRRQCKADFLHWLRIREWQDLHGQLRSITRGLGWTANEHPAAPDDVHRALLSGLLSHLGLKEGDTREMQGARGTKFVVWPGSALARKTPRWVMVGELVETSRLYGRTAAKIEPEWAEALAGPLLRRSYSEPHWSIKRQSVMAYERVTLYGVPLVAQRAVQYGSIDREVSRDLFLRHALVQGEWRTNHRFFAANRALLESVAELETRARRRDLLVDDETLFEFYDARVGPEVVSARHFDTWWKQARRDDPELLTFTPETVRNPAAAPVLEGDYPDAWRQGEITLPLRYSLGGDGAGADGVTVDIPVPLLNQVRPIGFDWLVPGMREELVVALIKSLPKHLRRGVVPAPDHARAALARVRARSGPVTEVIADALFSLTGTEIHGADFDLGALPDHLRMTFRAVDDDGTADRVVGSGKDLEMLRRTLAPAVRAAVSQASAGIEQAGLTRWSVGELPRTVEHTVGGQVVRGFPALVDDGATVAVRVLPSAAEQRRASAAGLRRLLLLGTGSPNKAVVGGMGNAAKLALGQNPHGSVAALLADCTDAAVDALVAEAGGPVWDEAGFTALQTHVRTHLVPTVTAVLGAVRPVLAAAQGVRLALSGARGEAGVDVAAQLDALVHPGFVARTGVAHLRDLARYLTAAQRRLDAQPGSADRDRAGMVVLTRVQAELDALRAALAPERREDPDVLELGWLVQELRVSLFAQSVGTAQPVSEKRVYKALDAIAR